MDAAARDAVRRQKAAGEPDLEINDVLASMAQTLVKQGTYTYHVEVQADPVPKNHDIAENKKPPKEVFYRKTALFATPLPGRIYPKRCTCQYLCKGAPAVFKCLSCAMYDPKGVGFFCPMCYESRHPWYRSPHVVIDISLDESIEHTLRVAHNRAEMIRFERDGTDLLDVVQGLEPMLNYVGDDFKVETQMKTAGHTATKLEERIHAFRRSMRDDLRRQGLRVSMNPDEAAIMLARVYKGWRVRKGLSLHFLHRLRRVKESGGATAFLDTQHGTVQRSRPRFLLLSHLPFVQLEGTSIHDALMPEPSPEKQVIPTRRGRSRSPSRSARK
jgi:hypothetical protein